MTSARFRAALLVGLLIRAATLPLPGHEDVLTWKIWAYGASRDVTSMYGVDGTPPERGVVTWGELRTTVDYPPVFLYEYGIVGWIYGALFPEFPNNMALHVAVKLPALLGNAGVALLLYLVTRRVTVSVTAGRWAALAYWLNPATIVGGEMLGYVDSVYLLPAIAGLVLAYFRRFWWAGALVGLAVATKPQAILIGPAFALVLWQSGRASAILQAGSTFCAAIVAAILPFYLRGALPNMFLAFGSFDARRDTMSAYAANIGWILNWALRVKLAVPGLGWRALLMRVPRPLSITRFRELGYPDPRPIGRVAVLIAAGWAMWTSRRSRDLAIGAAVGAFTVHAMFVFSPGLHEHHQLFEVPLLVLAASLNGAFIPLAVAVSAIVTLNINALYGAGLGVGWAVPRTMTGIDLTVLLAFVNVGVFVWFATVLRDQAKRSPQAR